MLFRYFCASCLNNSTLEADLTSCGKLFHKVVPTKSRHFLRNSELAFGICRSSPVFLQGKCLVLITISQQMAVKFVEISFSFITLYNHIIFEL